MRPTHGRTICQLVVNGDQEIWSAQEKRSLFTKNVPKVLGKIISFHSKWNWHQAGQGATHFSGKNTLAGTILFYESQKPIVKVIMIINSILCLLIETIFRITTNNMLLKVKGTFFMSEIFCVCNIAVMWAGTYAFLKGHFQTYYLLYIRA